MVSSAFAACVVAVFLPKVFGILSLHRPSGPSVASLLSTSRAQTCAGSRKIYADGYMRVGCETDISPKSSRYYFSELVCGKIPGCHASKKKMSPDVCFEFCRNYPVQYFAIQGDECYCTPWYHARTTKSGLCSWYCAGNQNEKCGSPDKMSLFSQHLCGDSAEEAAAVLAMGDETDSKAEESIASANTTEGKLYGASDTWNLGICSASKQNVCDLKGHWLDEGRKLNKLETKLKQAQYVMNKVYAKTKNFSDIIAEKDGNATGTDYSNLERTGKILKKKAVAVGVAANQLDMAVSMLAGPLLKEKPLDKFDELFQPLTDMSMKGTHAICDLPVAQQFAAVAEDDAAICANHCLDKGDDCAAFNYQYRDGLMACQFLENKDLVKPAFLYSVPVFEVTNTMVKELSFEKIGCFAKTAFMKENGRGPTKVAVLKQIVKAPSF